MWTEANWPVISSGRPKCRPRHRLPQSRPSSCYFCGCHRCPRLTVDQPKLALGHSRSCQFSTHNTQHQHILRGRISQQAKTKSLPTTTNTSFLGATFTRQRIKRKNTAFYENPTVTECERNESVLNKHLQWKNEKRVQSDGHGRFSSTWITPVSERWANKSCRDSWCTTTDAVVRMTNQSLRQTSAEEDWCTIDSSAKNSFPLE